MKNYNDIVSDLRIIARDRLRMEKVNSIRDTILRVENDKAEAERNLEDINIGIAVLNFDFNKEDSKHPRYDKIKKAYEEDIKYAQECKEGVEDRIKECVESIANLELEIEKVVNGEVKVSKDALKHLTNNLLDIVAQKAAAKLEVVDDEAVEVVQE